MKYLLVVAILFNISICSAQTPKAPLGKQPAKVSVPPATAPENRASPPPAAPDLLSKPFVFLNIYSEPEGAQLVLVESNENFGRTPFSKKYSVDLFKNHTRSDGCLHMLRMEARWVSGATASEVIRLCGGTTADYHYTFKRPKDAPFFDRDENYATALREKREREDKSLGEFVVVVKTVPEGAEIVEEASSGNKVWGRSPIQLTYEVGAYKRIVANSQDSCMLSRNFVAHWPSGVRSKAEKFSFCGEIGKEEIRVIERPVDAPGLQVDQNFAAALILERIRKENNDQQAQQVQRAQDQANQVQQRLAQEAQRQAEQDAFDNKAAAVINGLMSLVPQRQPAPIVIEQRSAPTQLRCVTKPRFGKLETVCE